MGTDPTEDGEKGDSSVASRKAALALVTVTLIALTACKKTVEGERTSWERNSRQVRELTTLYPAFDKALQEQVARAQQLMEAAGSAPEKERPGKMAEANRQLNAGFVSDLGRLDRELKELRAKVTTATAEAKDETARQAAKQVAADTARILAGVDDAIKRGAPDAAAASTVISRVMNDLNSASKNVETVLEAERKAAQAAKAQAAKAQPAVASPGASAQKDSQTAAPQTWKCSYCGNTNQASTTNCKSCGAPRS